MAHAAGWFGCRRAELQTCRPESFFAHLARRPPMDGFKGYTITLRGGSSAEMQCSELLRWPRTARSSAYAFMCSLHAAAGQTCLGSKSKCLLWAALC